MTFGVGCLKNGSYARFSWVNINSKGLCFFKQIVPFKKSFIGPKTFYKNGSQIYLWKTFMAKHFPTKGTPFQYIVSQNKASVTCVLAYVLLIFAMQPPPPPR